MQARILLVDDDPDALRFIESGLAARGFETATCSSAEEGITLLDRDDFDAVISDIHMSGMSGIDLCAHVTQNRPTLPVIVVTAFGNLDSAIAAIRAGAYDFVTKPVNLDALKLTLDRALQNKRQRDELKRLRREAQIAPVSGELIGASPPMRKVYSLLERVAESEASVVITGESGTGKEVVARALHRMSKRSSGPFVAVNCAAMPETLLESELFGHAKGAFTDAKAARSGLFVQATGGTLFLDEIGDMPLTLQPKLLRALQERTVRPVGSTTEIPYDARIMAATNRDIESAVNARELREDLYFRINVIRIELPPLRSRGNDIILLAQKFLERLSRQSSKEINGLSPAAMEKLLAYSWPGNVRELMNCMERAVALTQKGEIALEDLPEKVREHQSSRVTFASEDPADLAPLDEVERLYILKVFEAVGGNKSMASKVLGVDRKTLYRKLEKYGVLDASEEAPKSVKKPLLD